MEGRALHLAQLFLFAIWDNSPITIGLADAQQQIICNESSMLQNLPVCGKSFEEMMHKVDSTKWCNLREFILTKPKAPV
ncbi:receptor activity-modifying protein 3 isoform X2 [Erythrolamprus reginae]|uniref:receptor activity-modifying protein 3 isoform X2 n=1 Tax=Erythrolamprus reginae TaxID=121349 RepID=UPI00396C9BEC